jgi:hypothetical protein
MLGNANISISLAAHGVNCRNWQLPYSSILFWQTLVPGTLFTALTGLQRAAAREQLLHANLKNAIVLLGL